MVKPQVVIIDDEEDLLDLYEYNFSKRGFEVLTFSRAQDALEFLYRQQPDIILCDWMMPGMNGLDFCKRVKSNFEMADIPFMMVSCKTERSAVRQALAAGVSDYVSKPIGMNELVAKVNFILRSESPRPTGADS